MKRIFDKETPVIADIRTVTHNTMKRGHYPIKPQGRYSDCLVYVAEGSAVYRFKDYTLEVRAESLLYLAYDSFYSIDVTSDSYDVYFADYDFLYNCDGRYRCEAVSKAGFPARTAFDELYSCWEKKLTGYKPRSMALLYTVLAEMQTARERGYHPSRSFDTIRPSVEYMKENFCRCGLGMDEIAEASGITRVHFGRLFRIHYNTTPKKYLEHLRFERAKELLCSGVLTVSEVAQRCGFCDVYYFSRAFKSEFGIPPAKYALQARLNIQ